MKHSASTLFVTLLFFMIMTSCTSQTSISKSSSTPSTTEGMSTAIPTSSGSTSQAISDVAASYYLAIAKQNYDLAYSYLDAGAARLSRTTFTQEARSQDKEEGRLQSYSIAAFPPMVVITNMRIHLGPYHVHLQFKQEGNSWRIVSLDGI